MEKEYKGDLSKLTNVNLKLLKTLKSAKNKENTSVTKEGEALDNLL